MLRFSTWIISLLILFRTILTEDSEWHDKLHNYTSHDSVYTSRTARFGFDFLENLRKYFCHSSCMSADNMPYFTNLMCAVKCPELYLPHHSTTASSILTSPTMTTMEKTTVSSSAIPGSQTSQEQPSNEQSPTPSSTTISSTTISSTTISSTTTSSTTTSSTTTSSTTNSSTTNSSTTNSTTPTTMKES